MKVLVAGATGQTGRRIVQQLVAREIPVRALVRDLDRAQTLFPPQVERAVGDVLNPASLRAALADCTMLICATGAAPSLNPLGPWQVDYLGTKNLVDAAKAQGIQQFVLVSSLCVSQFFHPLNLFWLILVWKRQAEAYLEASGLTYTIVRPGGLKNEDNADAIVMAGADTLFEGSIPRSKVAQVCIEALFAAEAQQKIVEIVAKPDAPAQDLAVRFAQI